jgi:antitoxin component HigA of HigAB toxin-antitoxin module
VSILANDLHASYDAPMSNRNEDEAPQVSRIVKILLATREETPSSLPEVLQVSRASVTRLLNGGREWRANDIARLSRYFEVDPGLFFADPINPMLSSSVRPETGRELR